MEFYTVDGHLDSLLQRGFYMQMFEKMRLYVEFKTSFKTMLIKRLNWYKHIVTYLIGQKCLFLKTFAMNIVQSCIG